MKTLYLRPGACSLAVHIVLREIGEEFDIAEVDLMTKTLADGGDYLAVNPKGQVPALRLDDGTLLTEGPAINQYLGDTYPGCGLLPAVGTIDRYRVLEWVNYIATEIHKNISPLARGGIKAEDMPAALKTIESKFAVADSGLSGRDYLTDGGFTIADAYLFVVAGWMPMIGIDSGKFPNLLAYKARIASRPAVAAAMVAERLV